MSFIKHGLNKTPEHRCWVQMRFRCSNKRAPNYKDYGGRGIAVCDRWQSFENFIADMGSRPSDRHSIDRRDNNGNYEPRNCRWAILKTQTANRRCTLIFYIDGRRFTSVKTAAKAFGVTTMTIYDWTKGRQRAGRKTPPKDGCRAVRKYASNKPKDGEHAAA